MELSKNIIESLSNTLSKSHIAEDDFLQILEKTVSYICENSTEIKCIAKTADSKPVLAKKIFADILCLFVEAARHDFDEERLSNFLCQTCIDEHRKKKLCEAYVSNKKTIQSQLEFTGNNPPHVIDVDWHLDYRIKLDTCNLLGVPFYHVRLITKKHETISHVTFSCTIQQLQELISKLKDAVRYSEKLTNVILKYTISSE